MARAGCTSPSLDVDGISYTRDVIAPHLVTQHRPTVISCLFGDGSCPSLRLSTLKGCDAPAAGVT